MNLWWVEGLGTIGTIFIIIGLAQSNTQRLRTFNLIGSIIFIVYGALLEAHSVWVLNTICAILNILHLILRRPRKRNSTK